MSNLFSVFDPKSMFSLPLNWMTVIFVGGLLPVVFWLSPNQGLMAFKKFLLFFSGEMKAIFGPSMSPGSTFLFSSLFVFISLNNFTGLWPYIFTPSSHLVFSVSLALPMWLGHMMMAWLITPTSMLAHLVPLGTPTALMPFMVLIELVSSLIRPLTLSVRLAANMVAGHLLLSLLSGTAEGLNLFLLSFSMMALILLAVLETAVSIIQAYVFSVLSALYVSEVQSMKLN